MEKLGDENLKAIIPNNDYDRSKTTGECGVFRIFEDNDARGTREVKFRISTAKAAFNMNTALFTSKFSLNLRERLFKCYIWIIAMYGAETWTLQKLDNKYLGNCEIWC